MFEVWLFACLKQFIMLLYTHYWETKFSIKYNQKPEDFFWRRGKMKVNKDICVGCGTCVDSCPVSAISMVDGKAEINQEVCIHCGTCIGVCPVSAIEE